MKAARILTIAFVLGSLISMNASSALNAVSLHCHDGASTKAQLLSDRVYKIFAYVRGSRHVKMPIQCEYLLKQTISAIVMLEMRHAERPASSPLEEVAIPKFSVTLTRNRTVVVQFSWSSNSIKFIETQVPSKRAAAAEYVCCCSWGTTGHHALVGNKWQLVDGTRWHSDNLVRVPDGQADNNGEAEAEVGLGALMTPTTLEAPGAPTDEAPPPALRRSNRRRRPPNRYATG